MAEPNEHQENKTAKPNDTDVEGIAEMSEEELLLF